jgi:sulfotransferase
MKNFFFMAGLPRSGSTLLSALLNQNPEIYSGPSSPVVGMMLSLERELSNNELFLAYPKFEVCKQIIANLLPQFYMDVEKSVIIDKNRSWVNRPEYIEGYFGIEPKILCPVRNMDDVVASFVKMCHDQENKKSDMLNFIDAGLVKSNLPITDFNRAQFVCSGGIIGQSVDGIKQMLENGRRNQLHFIEYDDLMQNPQQTMDTIYEFLGLEKFKHDFNDINNVHQEDDSRQYGFENMHMVRKELTPSTNSAKDILPEEVLELVTGQEFWRNF